VSGAVALPDATGVPTLSFSYKLPVVMTGRAFGLQATGLVSLAAVPDTGPVATTQASTEAPPCTATLSTPLLTSDTLCASVVTAPGDSKGAASVEQTTIGVPGLPVIQVGAVQASSHTTCSNSDGQTTIASLIIGGKTVVIDQQPSPNTKISVDGITLTLNEQSPVPGADQGLTVNALHIHADGLLDLTLASATSDIHNC
jgi:hypothetical protein